MFYGPAFAVSCDEVSSEVALCLQELAKYRYAQISIAPAPSEHSAPSGLAKPRSDKALDSKDLARPNLTNAVSLWRYTLQPRWFPKFSSQWEVLKDQIVRTHNEGACTVFYSFPRSTPGFMAVNYLVSGPGTQYATLRAAVDVVAQLAAARNCQAIVCQAYSSKLNERLLRRWGYVPHAKNLGPNHFIYRLNQTN